VKLNSHPYIPTPCCYWKPPFHIHIQSYLPRTQIRQRTIRYYKMSSPVTRSQVNWCDNSTAKKALCRCVHMKNSKVHQTWSLLHRVTLNTLEYRREFVQQSLVAESDTNVGNICVVNVVAGDTFK